MRASGTGRALDVDPDERATFTARFTAAPPAERNEVTMVVGGEMAARSILPGMLSAIGEWRPSSCCGRSASWVPQVLVGLSKFVGVTAGLGARARMRDEVAAMPPVADAVTVLEGFA